MANQNDPKLLGKAAGKEAAGNQAVGKVMELAGVFNNRSDLTAEALTGLANTEKLAVTLGDRKNPHSEFSEIHLSAIRAMAGERMLDSAQNQKIDPKAVPSLRNNLVLAA